METTKFKIGDRVRVKSLKWYNEKKDSIGHIPIGQVFTDAMSKYCGSILTIKEIFEDIYIVNENTKNWQDWMLEDEAVTEEKQEFEQLKQKNMETKEMTLKEAQEYVKNTKYIVWSEDESIRLQNKLFEIGCKWMIANQRVVNTEYPFLYVDDKMRITYSIKELYLSFNENTNSYVHTDDIINIQLKEEKPRFDPATLRPFDKVLVREDNKNKEWFARFFEYYADGAYYTTSGVSWKYCIPYNDETKHLHGTIDEAPEFYRI